MSAIKCKMIIARSDKNSITFVCTTGHDEHSIYKYLESIVFKGVVQVGRVRWARMSGRRI